MAEHQGRTLADLKELAQTVAPEPEIAPPAPKLDAQGRAYATGRRKDAVARVWVKPGAGRITVNGRDLETYFARPALRMIINQPFVVASRAQQFDVSCTVAGGGLSGQAGAVRHGISRALVNYDPNLRPLTGHDAPVVEFLERETQATLLVEDIAAFLQRWIPRFALDQRASITVAIGCTGGRHRSIYIANELAARFRSEHPVVVRHRDTHDQG